MCNDRPSKGILTEADGLQFEVTFAKTCDSLISGFKPRPKTKTLVDANAAVIEATTSRQQSSMHVAKDARQATELEAAAEMLPDSSNECYNGCHGAIVTHACSDCSQRMCESCVNKHRRDKRTKFHKLSEIPCSKPVKPRAEQCEPMKETSARKEETTTREIRKRKKAGWGGGREVWGETEDEFDQEDWNGLTPLANDVMVAKVDDVRSGVIKKRVKTQRKKERAGKMNSEPQEEELDDPERKTNKDAEEENKDAEKEEKKRRKAERIAAALKAHEEAVAAYAAACAMAEAAENTSSSDSEEEDGKEEREGKVSSEAEREEGAGAGAGSGWDDDDNDEEPQSWDAEDRAESMEGGKGVSPEGGSAEKVRRSGGGKSREVGGARAVMSCETKARKRRKSRPPATPDADVAVTPETKPKDSDLESPARKRRDASTDKGKQVAEHEQARAERKPRAGAGKGDQEGGTRAQRGAKITSRAKTDKVQARPLAVLIDFGWLSAGDEIVCRQHRGVLRADGKITFASEGTHENKVVSSVSHFARLTFPPSEQLTSASISGWRWCDVLTGRSKGRNLHEMRAEFLASTQGQRSVSEGSGSGKRTNSAGADGERMATRRGHSARPGEGERRVGQEAVAGRRRAAHNKGGERQVCLQSYSLERPMRVLSRTHLSPSAPFVHENDTFLHRRTCTCFSSSSSLPPLSPIPV
jgi:hypothetical protein